MEIEGEIQIIKSDRKALAINNVWFNSYTPIGKDFNKGDLVKIVYSTKGDFNNIKSLTKSNKEKETEPKHKSDTARNCLVMQSVQLAIEKEITLDIATNEVIKSYNKIKEIV